MNSNSQKIYNIFKKSLKNKNLFSLNDFLYIDVVSKKYNLKFTQSYLNTLEYECNLAYNAFQKYTNSNNNSNADIVIKTKEYITNIFNKYNKKKTIKKTNLMQGGVDNRFTKHDRILLIIIILHFTCLYFLTSPYETSFERLSSQGNEFARLIVNTQENISSEMNICLSGNFPNCYNYVGQLLTYGFLMHFAAFLMTTYLTIGLGVGFTVFITVALIPSSEGRNTLIIMSRNIIDSIRNRNITYDNYDDIDQVMEYAHEHANTIIIQPDHTPLEQVRERYNLRSYARNRSVNLPVANELPLVVATRIDMEPVYYVGDEERLNFIGSRSRSYPYSGGRGKIRKKQTKNMKKNKKQTKKNKRKTKKNRH